LTHEPRRGLRYASAKCVRPGRRWTSLWAAALLALVLLLQGGGALAQDMEPRAFSAFPVDTNFLIMSYARTTGGVSLVPSLPISDVQATINTGTIAYDRGFDLFGQTASAGIELPYVEGHLTGDVEQDSRAITRRGLGDLRMRVTENLIGNPAQTPAEFAAREPTTTLGVSLVAVAPTGNYNPNHLINISANRWSFKPEIGVSQPIDDWFVEGAAGVWFFTDNEDLFHGHIQSEDPLWVLQGHVGYNFGVNFWLALDGTHYTGGQTYLNGESGHDVQTITRYGVTLSVPIDDGFSAKFAWSTWLTARNGGTFNTLTFSLQYRWFD